MRMIFTVTLVAVLAMTLSVWAGDKKGGDEGKRGGEKAKVFHKEQQTERKEHVEKQQEENEAFRKTLKGMTPEQREAAIKAHRVEQQQENREFNRVQHEENMAFLKSRLAHSKLTAEQKEELVKFCEEQHGENIDFRSEQSKERVAFLEKIANDNTLTLEQKKAAIRDFFAAQKTENEEHFTGQKEKRKAEIGKLKGEAKAVTPTATSTNGK